MKRTEIIKGLIEMVDADDGDYFDTVHAIALLFPRDLKEQLTQLVNGPIWDGNIISKTHRGRLFELGLAIRVCCKGEQGYTGARYVGYSILKKMNEIDAALQPKVRAV